MQQFQRGLFVGSQRHPDDQWDTLAVRAQTAAIYVEMRRLDAEATRTGRPNTAKPGDMLTGGVH